MSLTAALYSYLYSNLLRGTIPASVGSLTTLQRLCVIVRSVCASLWSLRSL